MSWTDDIERIIEIDYLQIAQCFPASDRGFARYRALWLESVADELASVVADPTGRLPLPAPFDRLVRAYLTEQGSGPVPFTAGPGVPCEERRLMIEAFLARVGAL
ncbi:hypothetical protein AB0D08_18895 [Kitasatospora sp. NPDC048540]|uniref:hypothetical protein n=1 Tax=unclassified Kitasatospora TaxID=2633591 RepID=UPI00053AFCEF|nr:hypothetical protein [Kitasatospora sp. MBT63]